MLTDIEISGQTKLKPITEIAKMLDITPEDLEMYGDYKAKIKKSYQDKISKNPDGKLVLVTAVNPTPAGEGKTTTTIGLGQALWKIGKKSLICLREPSLGPVFGMKGGAAGGGYAQIAPMTDINLHFTGDFHAITSAHLLLSAAIDNHIYWGNELNIDTNTLTWKRAYDVNDRALRNFTYSANGKGENTQQGSAMITTASEIMAIFCLASDIADLKKRLGNILFGYNSDGNPLYARDLGIHGAMTALLKDAIQPNLVQTLEGTPCIVHGGPFANIAHGCNSLIATKMALKMSPYTITEAGFGSDLGAEKFFDIKCQMGGLKPDAVVLVATIQSIKYNGGVGVSDLKKENTEAVTKGLCNLEKHIENMQKYNIPLIVCLNKFESDSDAEIEIVKKLCQEKNVSFEIAEGFAKGGEGMKDLANTLIHTLEEEVSNFTPIYNTSESIEEKIGKVAKEIYGASGFEFSKKAKQSLETIKKLGFTDTPICIAKTPVSFSDNPKLLGRPEGFTLKIQDIVLSAGAGFIVVIAGSVMTMPGLARRSNFEKIDIDENGEIVGLN
ncbi:formate--tetrahydrofolate ligase [Candidatus Gracilibacteria bacterium]|nr:MAG: formate--tetrahydrofolate ligase [Candidatus Gracilibacteria bacterium]